MTQQEIFGAAVWLGAPEADRASVYILRGGFTVRDVKKAVLRVAGLGFFECFINGRRVSDDRFMPLNSDYEPRPGYPPEETLSGHRLWVPEYDVTGLLTSGENSIALHFGGGWYDRPRESGFGTAKAIWRVFGESAAGEFDFVSSVSDRVGRSFVTDYDLTAREEQDFTLPEADALAPDFDDSGWNFAEPVAAPDADYGFSDCPPDRVCRTIVPRRTGKYGSVFDCGVNLTGTPVLKLTGGPGERVTVNLYEETGADGEPDPAYRHGQRLTFVCGPSPREARALFTWFGFRYFTVDGPAEPLCVEEIHADVARAASFRCDDETLNWYFETFVTTQLMNMHAGVPSDCPHLERRGYTGDGQLACHAAMTALDARAFYRKWIYDIMDCQDAATGHVQYTAPYIRSGGGPGGWGCAIVEVPYMFRRHYGDARPAGECWPRMMKYFDYLESKSENGLVTGDKPGEWCLGDWCTPETMILPPPFVNTYFYLRSLLRCVEMAPELGRQNEIPELRRRIDAKRAALTAAYYNPMDGNFLGCRQGANAFAADVGLGDRRTYDNLRAYYEALGGFDTGIFGTDVVTRVLFRGGDGDLAVRLLASESPHSFAEMKKRGATTLWEYFPGSLRDRSHSHPMFGAAAAYLTDYVLGIRQPEDSAGYARLLIAPCFVGSLTSVSGSRDLPQGRAEVSWVREGSVIRVEATVPPGVEATFSAEGKEIRLAEGKNTIAIVSRRSQ